MDSKIVIGLMSGTSMDGIDAAIVKINPDLTIKIISGLVIEYPSNIKKEIFKLINKQASVEDLCWLNFVIGEYFAEAALKVIKKAGFESKNIDLIGSHGQTVYHIPVDSYINGYTKKSTLQIGEPAIIAERTGITTIADFRTRDIAAGGQGAPLVCFADEVFFKSPKISRAIQNIGGMANVTVISPELETFAFDTGPGNVLIDYFTQKFFNLSYDKDGFLAFQGNINNIWLEFLLEESYYRLEPPKTTGRELFSKEYAEKILSCAPKNPYDIITTVTALTVKTICNAYKDFVFPKTKIDEIILGGGGAYNPYIIALMREYFGPEIKVLTHEDFGISNKYKEAVAFAILAYTTYYGIPNNVPTCTGANHKRVLGKVIY